MSPKRVSFRGRLWDAFQTFIGDNTPKRRTIARYIQRPGRILEIGCATGNVADVFRDFDYVGVDTDPELIALACRKFTEPNYRFYCLDVLAAELPEEADFDYVLISHTAHHLPDDYLKRLLHKSCQLLRPGGQLVILDMVRPEPDEPINKQLFYRLDRGEHFRNVAEFEALFAAEPAFVDPQVHIVKIRKLGIEVIDDVVIHATKDEQEKGTSSDVLGGHPKPAIDGQLKPGHRRDPR